MTYVDTTQRDEYTATSGQTVFAYTFRILANSDLKVYNDGTLQTLTVHYTVSGAGTAGGGNVTFVTGVTLNNTVIIMRDTPDTQNTDYTVGGAFPALATETAFDKRTMKEQDLEEKIARAIKFAVTSLLNDIDAPEGSSATDRAGKVWAWDSAGTGLGLLAATVVDAISVIAAKGDLAQGDAAGDAANLAIGSTGDLLTVVSGLAAWSSGITGRWDLLQTSTGGGASYDFDAKFTANYNLYLAVLRDLTAATTGDGLYTRVGVAGYDSGATDYRHAGLSVEEDTAANSVHTDGSEGTTLIQLSVSTFGADAHEQGDGIVFIHDPKNTGRNTRVSADLTYMNSDGDYTRAISGGLRLSDQADDSIRFGFTTDAIASGTIELYGLRI